MKLVRRCATQHHLRSSHVTQPGARPGRIGTQQLSRARRRGPALSLIR